VIANDGGHLAVPSFPDGPLPPARPHRRSAVPRIPAAVACLALAVALVAAPPPASADHAVLHDEPQGPAAAHFPADFPELSTTSGGSGSAGSAASNGAIRSTRPPVIFVHGNTADHGDWYPVRDDFVAAGWSEQELWALSYNGLGANVSSTEARDNPQAEDERAEMGHDGLSRATSNEVNVPTSTTSSGPCRTTPAASGSRW
jgi:hypothetical protein